MKDPAFLQGFLFMGSIIAGLGPQNLHVLRAGITASSVGLVVFVCCFGDLLLTVLGVMGLGYFLGGGKGLLELAKVLAFALLVWHASQALIRVHEARNHLLGQTKISRPVQQAFLLTFFNPCVYLDTVLLVGMRSNFYEGESRWWFAAGSVLASLVWYCALGFGSKSMSRVLGTPRSLDRLDRLTAVILYCNAWQVSRLS